MASTPIKAAPAESVPAPINQCRPPAIGRYALLGAGQQNSAPVAVLMQEHWLPGGRIEGVRYVRQGRRFSEDRYIGTIKRGNDCWVSIERRGPAGVMLSADTLNRQGTPTASLITSPVGALSLRYISQGNHSCRVSQLNGLVTSHQQGQSWQGDRWVANAVVQREWWQNGQVSGVAQSSYGGRISRAPYSGKLSLDKDCLGSMRQRDSQGVAYNYKVLLLNQGSGYVYLQTDPNDLTLGVLQEQP